MTTHYSSFKDIEARLKVLKLQREIASESLKLRINKAKTTMYPVHLLGGFSGMVQKLLLTFAIKKLSRLFDKRVSKITEEQKNGERVRQLA